MTNPTTVDVGREHGPQLEVASYTVSVVSGPDRGREAKAVEGKLIVGSADTATLRLTDSTVSRFHLELEGTRDGIIVRDLGSTNGTKLVTLTVREIVVRDPVELDLGRTRIKLRLGKDPEHVPAASGESFGDLLGRSEPMRALYAVLQRAAPTSAPVLILGESGTGKELAARALHDHSPRAGKAFEIVDCGGLPPTLIESELFGHERGAFTGAVGEREGAFERAHGGTLFLDELGEMPVEVQPKLLRVLAEGQVRRLAGRKLIDVDVRVVAATNRDLRREVNGGTFRADLYYRLAVIPVRMPALRERIDDLAILVPALLSRIRSERRIANEVDVDAALLGTLAAHNWPGNVRELRNYLERLAILQSPPQLESSSDATIASDGWSLPSELAEMPMAAARATLNERFEREYVATLLERSGGNVAAAARRAGVDRGTLFRILRRHNTRAADEGDDRSPGG